MPLVPAKGVEVEASRLEVADCVEVTVRGGFVAVVVNAWSNLTLWRPERFLVRGSSMTRVMIAATAASAETVVTEGTRNMSTSTVRV